MDVAKSDEKESCVNQWSRVVFFFLDVILCCLCFSSKQKRKKWSNLVINGWLLLEQRFIRFLSKTKLEPLLTVFSVQKNKKDNDLGNLIIKKYSWWIAYFLQVIVPFCELEMDFFSSKNENVKVGGSVLFSCLFVKINHPDEKCCDLRL